MSMSIDSQGPMDLGVQIRAIIKELPPTSLSLVSSRRDQEVCNKINMLVRTIEGQNLSSEEKDLLSQLANRLDPAYEDYKVKIAEVAKVALDQGIQSPPLNKKAKNEENTLFYKSSTGISFSKQEDWMLDLQLQNLSGREFYRTIHALVGDKSFKSHFKGDQLEQWIQLRKLMWINNSNGAITQIVPIDQLREFLDNYGDLIKKFKIQGIDYEDLLDIHDINIDELIDLLPNLTHLTLQNCNINNPYLLAEYRGLISIDLSDNCIGIEGAKSLVDLNKNTNLQRLDLSNNKIGSEGLASLVKGLATHPSLQSLYLDGNNINSVGGGLLAGFLAVNNVLKELGLGKNPIGDGVAALGESLKTNSSLEVLNLYDNEITGKAIAALGEALEVNNSLKILKLNTNQIDGEGAAKLAEGLRINRSVVELTLHGNRIGDVGAIKIAEILKGNNSLRLLDLGGNQISGDSINLIWVALKDNHTLQELDLSRNSLRGLGTASLDEFLIVNKSLLILNLRNTHIGNGAVAIGKALETNQTLHTLDLADNEIDVDGANAIGNALKVNHSIRQLDLAGNFIRPAGATALAAGLKANTTLQKLNLGFNFVGNRGTTILAEGLKTNKSLQILYLNNNDIQSEGAGKLGQSLQSNQGLTMLILSNNEIGDLGIAGFKESLKTNKTLTVLDFSHNKIGNEGAAVLRKALRFNQTLRDFYIDHNLIDNRQRTEDLMEDDFSS